MNQNIKTETMEELYRSLGVKTLNGTASDDEKKISHIEVRDQVRIGEPILCTKLS